MSPQESSESGASVISQTRNGTDVRRKEIADGVDEDNDQPGSGNTSAQAEHRCRANRRSEAPPPQAGPGARNAESEAQTANGDTEKDIVLSDEQPHQSRG